MSYITDCVIEKGEVTVNTEYLVKISNNQTLSTY